MEKEYSAGAVIYRNSADEPLFLLVYSGRNGNWGFPKGHIEPGENELEAARREIFEETGLRELDFLTGFREEEVYPVVSMRPPHKGQRIEKHAIYHLCRTNMCTAAVDEEEITDYVWVSLEKAEELLPFASMKALLRKARTFIATKEKGPA